MLSSSPSLPIPYDAVCDIGILELRIEKDLSVRVNPYGFGFNYLKVYPDASNASLANDI